MFAFNRRTGEEVWTAGPINKAWTCPCLVEVADGKSELILNHKDEIVGYDPLTGKRLWWCAGIEDYVVPVPITHNGVVYCLGGRSNKAIAVKPGGRAHPEWPASGRC